MRQPEDPIAPKQDKARRKIVVTGGLGFIGARVFRHLAAREDTEVTIFDSVTYAADVRRISACAADANKFLVRGDIRNPDEVARALEGCDTVVHLAAETHEPRFFAYPERFFEVNAAGTETVVRAAVEQGVGHFVHVSTGAVYGAVSGRADETACLRPVTPYGHSKALAEEAVMLAAQEGLRATILRPGATVGAGQNPEKLFPRLIVKALQGRCLPVEGEGNQEWAFLPVDDLVAAIDLILEANAEDRLSVFNIAGVEQLSALDLARLVFEVTGRQTGLEFVQSRHPETGTCRMDDSRIRSLGYRQKGSVRAELQAVRDAFRVRTRDLPLRYRLGV